MIGREILRTLGKIINPSSQKSDTYVFDTDFDTENKKSKEESQKEMLMIAIGALMFISLVASIIIISNKSNK